MCTYSKFVKVHFPVTNLCYNQPMKKSSRTANNIFLILTAMLISALMCFCMCACGDSTNTEETVEITTPSEEAADSADNPIKIGDKSKDKDSSEKSDDSDDSDKSSSSQYAKIYKACNTEMKEASAKYVDELEEESSSLSKSKLYDETQAKIEDLKKIYDDGKDKMVKTMLASTEDDAKEYEKYFQKMTEAYTEYSRDLTTVYTDAF